MNVEKYLNNLESQILNSKEIEYNKLSKDWSLNFVLEGGVYLLKEAKKIVYIGETQSLRKRMLNLRSTYNHTVRRTIGIDKFSKIKGFIKGTSHRKFEPDIVEKKLDEYMIQNIKISYLAVALGRKELEETLIAKYKPKYNKR